MADKFGNYFAAFLMAGGVAIVASLIPFLLICVKQEQKKNFDDDVEETVSPGQLEGVDDTGLESKGGSQDSISTIGRDRLIRSSSFAIALDSPIFWWRIFCFKFFHKTSVINLFYVFKLHLV